LVGIDVDGMLMSGLRSSKNLTFVAMMAALGNVLSFISIQLAPLVPSIPVGPVSISLALDFSHLATFITALYGGPVIGGLTGLIGGLVAAFEFGFSKGNLISGFGIPVGKAMTGVVAGLVMSMLRASEKRSMLVPSTLVSYIPEGILTAFIFISLYPLYFGMPSFLATAIATQVLVKAVCEMIAMGLVLMFLADNRGFTAYLKGVFS